MGPRLGKFVFVLVLDIKSGCIEDRIMLATTLYKVVINILNSSYLLYYYILLKHRTISPFDIVQKSTI